jgi:ParB family chromosome partitioning protein
MMAVVKKDPFADLGNMLKAGLSDELLSNVSAFRVSLDDIEVIKQDRETFENPEQSLADLGKELRQFQISPILLRVMPSGNEKPYRLVAGERRIRAARIEGLDTLEAKAAEMTDAQADHFQFAENNFRLNLAALEIAKKLERDLRDKYGGDRKALADAINKPPSWISKHLSMLDLTPQAARLVKTGATADIEAIGAVKMLEKVDPIRAQAFVDDIQKSLSLSKMQKSVEGKQGIPSSDQADKGEVKSLRERAKAEVRDAKITKQQKPSLGNEAGIVATPKNRKHEEPSTPVLTPGEGADSSIDPVEVLAAVYQAIAVSAESPKKVVGEMTEAEAEAVSEWLREHYKLGRSAKDLGRAVYLGIQKGVYGNVGASSLALMALLSGADSVGGQFSLIDICSRVRP